MNPKPLFSFLRNLTLLLAIAGLTHLFSCKTAGSSTQITGSWKDPGATSYKDFFVIVISKNLPARRTLESDIFFKLKKEGATGALSLEVFPETEKPATEQERNAIVEKIQSLGHQAIIAVSLRKTTEESRFVPGQAQYAPTNVGYGTGYNNQLYQSAAGPVSYGTFGGYYNSNFSVASSDGYYESLKTYFVETNVYDSKTSKLVWSAQSETFNPMNLEAASSGFSTELVKAMKTSGIIKAKK